MELINIIELIKMLEKLYFENDLFYESKDEVIQMVEDCKE